MSEHSRLFIQNYNSTPDSKAPKLTTFGKASALLKLENDEANQKKIEEINQLKIQLNTILEKEKQESNELDSKLNEIKIKREILNDLKLKHNSLEEIKSLEDNLKNLKEENDKLQIEILSLKFYDIYINDEKREELTQNIYKVNETLNSLKLSRDAINKEIENNSWKLQTLKQSCSDLDITIEDTKEQLENLEKKLDKKRDKINHYTTTQSKRSPSPGCYCSDRDCVSPSDFKGCLDYDWKSGLL